MNLKSLKKDELIEKCEELQQLVNNQKYLKQAVETKDNEISKLKEELKHKDSQNKNKESERLNQAMQAKDNEIENLKKQFKKDYDSLKRLLDKRVNELNSVVFQYGALLKTLQGTLDSHIELNDRIVNDIKGGN